MNTGEYIESGILEAYILGALSEKEAAEVQANIARYPEIAAEVAEIEWAMKQFAASHTSEPPPALQDKIWEAVKPRSAVEPPSIEKPLLGTARHMPLPVPVTNKFTWQYAAGLALLTGSVALNILLWQQSKTTRNTSQELASKINTVEAKQQDMAAELANYHTARNMMADTGMQTVIMHTVVKGHPMAATLYWSKSNGETYVAIDALPVPPAGMQYQLWVMQGGVPVDMGVIEKGMANTPAMQKVAKAVTNGEAFAISLEKEGGSLTPTMDQIYVMGKPS